MERILNSTYVNMYEEYRTNISFLEKLYFRHLIKSCIRKIRKIEKLFPFENFGDLTHILLSKDYECFGDLHFALSQYNHDIYFYSQALLHVIDKILEFCIQKRSVMFHY